MAEGPSAALPLQWQNIDQHRKSLQLLREAMRRTRRWAGRGLRWFPEGMGKHGFEDVWMSGDLDVWGLSMPRDRQLGHGRMHLEGETLCECRALPMHACWRHGRSAATRRTFWPAHLLQTCSMPNSWLALAGPHSDRQSAKQ